MDGLLRAESAVKKLRELLTHLPQPLGAGNPWFFGYLDLFFGFFFAFDTGFT